MQPRPTVAAPLTCTDLLAMDRVPGTRSTDGGASFCLSSVATASLEEETQEREAAGEDLTFVFSGQRDGDRGRRERLL